MRDGSAGCRFWYPFYTLPAIAPPYTRTLHENRQKPMRKKAGFLGVWMLAVLVTTSQLTQAQATPDVLLAVDAPLTVEMQADTPLVFGYAGQAGETITVTARSLDPQSPVDTVLELRLTTRRLAYSDNHTTDRADLLPTDSAVVAFALPADGLYTLRLDSYGSIGVGMVELLLVHADPFAASVTTANGGAAHITGTLPPHRTYQYVLSVQAGDRLSITARDTSSSLDPVLRVLDAAGRVLAFNDDHATLDPRLDVLDAQITDLRIDHTGLVTITLADFTGAGGTFEMRLSVWGAGEAGTDDSPEVTDSPPTAP